MGCRCTGTWLTRQSPAAKSPGTSHKGIAERDQAKAAELGVSLRTVKTRRARYTQQGLWGLVDRRAVRLAAATGRTDARLVAAIREVIDAETDTSTGTRSRLIR